MEQEKMKLTSALRLMGVVSLVASALIFMVQGFFALSSFERFLSFGALAAGLGALGLFIGTKMDEPKSARTFLGLAAASTPVLFSQLGAMIYGLLNPAPSLPQALIVTAPSLAVWAAAVAVTCAVMAQILLIGFGAFYRQESRRLVLILLAGSLSLLIPSRLPTLTASIGFALLAALMVYFIRRRSAAPATPTLEQEIARMIVFLPLVILIGRGLFYMTNALFLSMAMATLAVTCFVFQGRQRVEFIMRAAGSSACYFALVFLVGEVCRLPELWLLCAAYPATLILHSARWPGRKENDFLTLVSRNALILIPVLSLLDSFTLLAATASLLLGAGAASFGISRREHPVFLSGLTAVVTGLAFFVSESWRILSEAPWISLAILGIAVILLAGWLEKNRGKVAKLSAGYREHFALRPDPSAQQ